MVTKTIKLAGNFKLPATKQFTCKIIYAQVKRIVILIRRSFVYARAVNISWYCRLTFAACDWRKMYYFCFVADKVKKTPKKKLPDNNLKVSAPTVFTSLEFLKTQNSDLCSITEIFIDFIGVLGKKCHFHIMHLTRNGFTWICSVLHL